MHRKSDYNKKNKALNNMYKNGNYVRLVDGLFVQTRLTTGKQIKKIYHRQVNPAHEAFECWREIAEGKQNGDFPHKY